MEDKEITPIQRLALEAQTYIDKARLSIFDASTHAIDNRQHEQSKALAAIADLLSSVKNLLISVPRLKG